MLCVCVCVVRMISQIYHCKKKTIGHQMQMFALFAQFSQDKSLKNSFELNTQFSLLLTHA